MRNILLLFALFSLMLVAISFADEIKFKNGKTLKGQVLEFKKGQIKIRKEDGKIITGEIDKIEEIDFEVSEEKSNVEKPADAPEKRNTTTANAVYRKEMIKVIANAKKALTDRPNAAIVAMYIDTENSKDTLPQGEIDYKCFYVVGGGYSGIQRINLRQAFVRFENCGTGSDLGNRRIELDPGPPYANIKKEVVLVPGEVCDLGRIVLEKVKAEGTASISGIVRDIDDNPIEGASVSDGKRQVQTGPDGRYSFDDFGLEIVSLTASKKSYFGDSVKVLIRNMDQRSLKQDIKIYRPMRLKMEYVISSPESSSLVGPGVEQGSFEIFVDSTYKDLKQLRHSSPNFTTFVNETQLKTALWSGKLQIFSSYGPMFYQEIEGADFGTIKEVGSMDYNKQRSPNLQKGTVFLIRGFQKPGEFAVSKFCLKMKVEELSYE